MPRMGWGVFVVYFLDFAVMALELFNRELLSFLKHSPTPFHAVEQMRAVLLSEGFVALDEASEWHLQPGGRYVVTRNGSSLIAFVHGRADLIQSGVRMVGAHTDSPCLRLKPQPELQRQGIFQLGVEVYGGALLNPWFDRDLSLAGRVTYLDEHGRLGSALIDFQRAVAIIPSLAIHLDRDVNNARSVNAQQHLPVVVSMLPEQGRTEVRQLLLEQLRVEHPLLQAERVLDYEMSFYDAQSPAMVGLHDDFIASGRLDNLLSCYIGMRSLIHAGDQNTCILVATDHEEVGSLSACGARGTFLKAVLARLCPDPVAQSRMLERSMLISADNAHAVHPNYSDKHDANHGPLLNGGPVIKVNSNQSYASNSETAAVFRRLCELAGVPVQSFVTRSDLGCGSTIGPLTAAEVGVRTVDVGVPQLAMHSPRELAGAKDAHYMYRALNEFWHFGF